MNARAFYISADDEIRSSHAIRNRSTSDTTKMRAHIFRKMQKPQNRHKHTMISTKGRKQQRWIDWQALWRL